MSENDHTLVGRDILSLFYAFLAALGISFYLSWSYLYNAWTDIGVYSVSVVLIGLGVIGYLLYSIEE